MARTPPLPPVVPSGRKPSRAVRPKPAPVYGVAPPIDSEVALAAAVSALAARDPTLIGRIVALTGTPPLRRRAPGFAGLAEVVMGQQVSTASAAAIFGRLRDAIVPLEPAPFLAADDGILRTAGLSAAKVRSLRAAAVAALDGQLPIDDLGAMPADEAHRLLVRVPGIGPWTADSFLLFCLGHPDAWPSGDIALQEALRLLQGSEARPNAAELDRMGERWRPHRAVAARLLWAYYRLAKGRSGITLDAT